MLIGSAFVKQSQSQSSNSVIIIKVSYYGFYLVALCNGFSFHYLVCFGRKSKVMELSYPIQVT
jgi:hypothetical protein